jgi:hypothetical protein
MLIILIASCPVFSCFNEHLYFNVLDNWLSTWSVELRKWRKDVLMTIQILFIFEPLILVIEQNHCATAAGHCVIATYHIITTS